MNLGCQDVAVDERDLVEITSDAYPGERLMVCRNPLLVGERARKRSELLVATEASVEAEVQLDGLYIIRTRLPEGEISGPGTVRTYKHLIWVE